MYNIYYVLFDVICNFRIECALELFSIAKMVNSNCKECGKGKFGSYKSHFASQAHNDFSDGNFYTLNRNANKAKNKEKKNFKSNDNKSEKDNFSGVVKKTKESDNKYVVWENTQYFYSYIE